MAARQQRFEYTKSDDDDDDDNYYYCYDKRHLWSAGSPKGHKCAMPAAEVSTVYTLSKHLNQNVFSCVLKV